MAGKSEGMEEKKVGGWKTALPHRKDTVQNGEGRGGARGKKKLGHVVCREGDSEQIGPKVAPEEKVVRPPEGSHDMMSCGS